MSISDSSLEVIWPDGTTMHLPYLWLRDNCDCSECRVEQTSEKRFHVASIEADLTPAEVRMEGDCLHLIWPDGHHTYYSGESVRALAPRATVAWRPWNREFQPRRTKWQDLLEDDHCAMEFITDFLQTGAAILVDTPTEPDSLENLAPRLGPVRELLFERIHNVEVDPTGYNIAHTALALPPHNDFVSYSWPPSVQVLHMLRNEAPGGDSIIVDGWAVLEQLRRDYPDLFNILCSVPVPFRQFDDNNETYAVVPMVQCDPAGEITVFRYSNQLMQTMVPTAPRVAEFYRAFHELSRRIISPEAKVSFRLEGGHALVVAGHRVLHGRDAFQMKGRRHLQDAYYDHDNIRNKLVLLKRKMSEKNKG